MVPREVLNCSSSVCPTNKPKKNIPEGRLKESGFCILNVLWNGASRVPELSVIRPLAVCMKPATMTNTIANTTGSIFQYGGVCAVCMCEIETVQGHKPTVNSRTV